MSEINTGGPAFPVPEFPMPGGQTFLRADLQGMTLMDYFAALAMQARVSAAWINPESAIQDHSEWLAQQPEGTPDSFYRYVAEASYEQACAMLLARKGGQA